MKSKEIRSRFLAFFKKRGHAIIPSASLVPENDPSVLFTTAGMQPLVPYLLGAKHPAGNRLVNSQKCVRTQDIDEIGDNTHNTFFEMLGNWSLGDPDAKDGIGAGYFKKDAITWSYEFLTSKEEGLGLDPKRLYVTVFGGNEDAPKDTESCEIWRSLGMPENRIYWMEGTLAEKNWWSPGDNGPCGPDTEMFYDVTGKLDLKNREEFLTADERQEVVEVWNDVFMEYEKKNGKVVGKLKQKNVDTGAGLERLSMVLQKTDNVFDTDLFKPLIIEIKKYAKNYEERAARIVADHIRTAVFMIADGVMPSNTDRGYILRRIVRRAVRYADAMGISLDSPQNFVRSVVENYADVYQNLEEKETAIVSELEQEGRKFRKTLRNGLKEFEKISSRDISGLDAFRLFSTYGFPLEITEELARERNVSVDRAGFEAEFKKHQDLSRTGAEQKFKGGLADTNPKTVMLHTATHLMLAALRKYLGEHVHQAGSNITSERTRFDFNHPEKVPPEILRKVEDYVNEAIAKECTVVIETMSKEKAQRGGVEGSFWEKYPDAVNVYVVKAKDGTVYSRELCGGPHVKNTSEIGKFKIVKEEAVAAGIRRIKAIVE